MNWIMPWATGVGLMLAAMAFAQDAGVGAHPGPQMETEIYKKTPDGELAIHLHFPPGWTANDKRPAIVFFFGGAWTSGSPKQFEFQANYLATRGMVAARADYRIRSKHNVMPDKCVEDAKSAVRWIRQNAARLGVDPDRIVASGGSAGAHIAACTFTTEGLETEGEDLTVSSKPNLLVLFNPVLDLTGMAERLGGAQETAELISPNRHLTKDVPPTILFYGTEDKFLAMGREFIRQAKELEFEAELYTAEGQGHAFFNRSPWLEVTLYLADQFLVKHGYVQGEPTLKLPEGAEMKRET